MTEHTVMINSLQGARGCWEESGPTKRKDTVPIRSNSCFMGRKFDYCWYGQKMVRNLTFRWLLHALWYWHCQETMFESHWVGKRAIRCSGCHASVQGSHQWWVIIIFEIRSKTTLQQLLYNFRIKRLIRIAVRRTKWENTMVKQSIAFYESAF